MSREFLSVGWSLGSSMCVFLLAAIVQAADSDSSARQELESRGLQLVRDVWLNSHELELREQLGRLEEVEREFQLAQRYFEAVVQRNRTISLQIQQTEAQIKSLQASAARSPSGGSLRKKQDEALKQLREQLKDLRAKYLEPAELVKSPVALQGAVRLNDAKAQAMRLTLQGQRSIRQLKRSYRTLKQDQKTQVLVDAVSGAKLGPAGNYQSELLRLQRLSETLAQGKVPLFQEGGHSRVMCLLNERVPVTFSILGADGPVLISRSVAQLAGIEPDGTAGVNYRLPDGRDLKVQAVKLRQLRLGAHTWDDLEVLVLPPEASDWGSSLTPSSLPGVKLQLNLEQLEIEIVAEKK